MRLMGTRLRLFLTLILRYAAANNTRQVADIVPAARAKDSGGKRFPADSANIPEAFDGIGCRVARAQHPGCRVAPGQVGAV
jgi:hypothetical protein